MTSLHVVDQLPLWVEGDLPEAEAKLVSEHLLGCPSCTAVAEALRESQAWLKDSPPLPFGEGDFASLRRTVMAQIAPEKAAPAPMQVTRLSIAGPLLAAAAALLLVYLAPWSRPASTIPRVNPDRAVVSSPQPRPESSSQPSLQMSVQPVRSFAAEAAPRQHLATEELPAIPIRIELQTPNPNVRIVWLPNSPATPEPAPFS